MVDVDLLYLPLRFIENKWLYLTGYVVIYFLKHQSVKRLSFRVEALEKEVFKKTQMNIEQDTARNSSSRFRYKPDKIVVHWTGIGGLESSKNWFKSKNNLISSAHYIVEDERILQMVPENRTAWHTGNWLANLTSIGIEISATEDRPVSDASYKTVVELIIDIHRRTGIAIDALHRHNEYKTTRCPGTIDFDRIKREIQLVLQPKDESSIPAPSINEKYSFSINLEPKNKYQKEVVEVQKFLIAYGYMLPIPENEYGWYGKKTQAAIDTFQKQNNIIASEKYYGWWYDKTRAKANTFIRK